MVLALCRRPMPSCLAVLACALLAGPLLPNGGGGGGLASAKVVLGTSASGVTPPGGRGTAKQVYKTNVKASARPAIGKSLTLPEAGGGGDGEDEAMVVPFIAGQGLNNQLWEYRAAATVARALNRTLCLEPAHRFYLTTTGREFIPFNELFDVEAMRAHVRAVVGGGACARACGGRIHRMLALTQKPTEAPKNPYTITDWRPGSLLKFGGSTGFRAVPPPTMVYVAPGTVDDLVGGGTFMERPTSGARCVGLQGTGGFDQIEGEKTRWTAALRTAPRLLAGARRVQQELLNDEPYLAIHWRFEETKCAGYGVSIGNGRDAGELVRAGQRTATKGGGDLCFFAGVVPDQKPVKIWLRMVSREQVAAAVLRIMAEHGVKRVFLATDGKDEELVGWVKRKTGAVTLGDLPRGWDAVRLADNDIASRLEQQLCQDSHVFMGTQGSSWTLAVIEDRFKSAGKTYTADKWGGLLTRPSATSMFFDMEVCDCEWTPADSEKARAGLWKT